MTKILIDRATVEQALEALGKINKLSVGENAICLPAEIDGAMDSLHAALAEPEPRNQCGETCQRAKLCAVCARGLAEPVQEPECWCHKCNKNRIVNGIPFSATRMILCPTCGNKRCPHASDHRLACTDSNAPGQPGSVYTSPPQRKPILGV